jgi:lipoprotein-anchoring transpeptidase ErfK/SrfK
MKKRILVILSRQRLFAFEDDALFHECDCATGNHDHPTDVGVFKILRKAHPYRSKKYNAQMDYAMFFSPDGKAIHKAYFVGPTSYMKFFGVDWFGSHGCVRLAESDAQKLFAWGDLKTVVEIVAAESTDSNITTGRSSSPSARKPSKHGTPP